MRSPRTTTKSSPCSPQRAKGRAQQRRPAQPKKTKGSDTSHYQTRDKYPQTDEGIPIMAYTPGFTHQQTYQRPHTMRMRQTNRSGSLISWDIDLETDLGFQAKGNVPTKSSESLHPEHAHLNSSENSHPGTCTQTQIRDLLS